jgi:hypothetical protein
MEGFLEKSEAREEKLSPALKKYGRMGAVSIRLLKRRTGCSYHGAAMYRWLYILTCVLVPLVWGLAVAAVSRRIDEWAKRRRDSSKGNVMNPDDATRIEYHI